MEEKKRTKDDLILFLAKKYYLRITQECIELSVNIEDCFDVREGVVSNIKKMIERG